MKILSTVLYNDWDPSVPQDLDVAVFDLEQEKHLLAVVLMLANGIIAEACFDAETAEGLGVIRGLVQGTGSARPPADPSLARNARLYRSDYDCFLQSTAVFLFVGRAPRPELFGRSDHAAYIAEFDSKRA